jgi:hypothetical protein
MSENQTPEVLKQANPNLRIEYFDDFPTGIRGSRSVEYDEAIKEVLNAPKSTISVEIEGKIAKQMYSTFHSRVVEFNSNPERTVDLKQRTLGNKVYLKKLPKGSLALKKQN